MPAGGSTTGIGTSTTSGELPTTSTTSTGGSEDSTTKAAIPGSTTTEDLGSSSETSSDGGDPSSAGTATVSRVEEGLVVLYRLDEGSGTTVHDTAPSGSPIDLSVEGTGYTWAADGLHFAGDDATIAASTTSTEKIDTACQATDELSVEAWLTPDTISVPGPPRILTYSMDSAGRNFSLLLGTSLEQDLPTGIHARLRVAPGPGNGTPDTVADLDESVVGEVVHVVYVREANGDEQIFADAEVVTASTRPGDFSSWATSDTMRLGLGNEFINRRPLQGTIHLAAIYCRALTAAEIAENYQAGF